MLKEVYRSVLRGKYITSQASPGESDQAELSSSLPGSHTLLLISYSDFLFFKMSPESVSIPQPPECVDQQTLSSAAHPASGHSVLQDEADPEVNVARVPVHLLQRPHDLVVWDERPQRGPGDLRGRRGEAAPL